MSGSVLCTTPQYTTYTRDRVPPDDIDDLLAEAERLVAARLRRIGIAQSTYTERMRIFYDPAATGLFGPSGWVYPSATPVASVVTPAGTTVLSDGVTIRDVSPDADPSLFGSPIQLDRYATVTYIGGWTAEDVPAEITAAIGRVARNLQAPYTPGGGALLSVSQGDTRVTYARAGAATQPIDDATWASIRPWKFKEVA